MVRLKNQKIPPPAGRSSMKKKGYDWGYFELSSSLRTAKSTEQNPKQQQKEANVNQNLKIMPYCKTMIKTQEMRNVR